MSISPKHHLTQWYPVHSMQAKAGISGPLRYFLPKDIPFLLKHLCFALMPSEGVPGVWHLGPPKPLLGTEQISADVSL